MIDIRSLFALVQDPPGYFENVVWPGYVEAHKAMFENGDVEQGRLIQPSEETQGDGVSVNKVVLFEVESVSLDDIVATAGQEVERGILAKE